MSIVSVCCVSMYLPKTHYDRIHISYFLLFFKFCLHEFIITALREDITNASAEAIKLSAQVEAHKRRSVKIEDASSAQLQKVAHLEHTLLSEKSRHKEEVRIIKYYEIFIWLCCRLGHDSAWSRDLSAFKPFTEWPNGLPSHLLYFSHLASCWL
jgi:hypothetical protein